MKKNAIRGYEKISLSEGIQLMLIPRENYKSIVVSIYIKRPLNRKEVTWNSLLPSVMKSSTRSYMTPMAIAKKLQSLYGVTLGVSVDKIGERQILSFRMSTVADVYLPEPVFMQALMVMKEMLTDPSCVDGGFLPEYVEIEKENLAEDIRSKINDKGRYAFDRCIELMCDQELYSISEDGYIEDLELIDRKSLYQHYREIIATSSIDIVVSGDVHREELIAQIKEIFSFDRENIVPIVKEVKKPVHEVRVLEERMDITQGKLVMGYRTNVDIMDEDYYAVVVYNAIFGGGAHSKLFLNVREKYSLCYSIYSVMEKFKGLLIVNAGIEVSNYEEAVRLIELEMQDMKEGKISDIEFSNAKSYLINGLMSLKDSLYAISDFYYNQSICGKNITLEEMADKIAVVSKEDIVRVAQKIQQDTIYFLRSK